MSLGVIKNLCSLSWGARNRIDLLFLIAFLFCFQRNKQFMLNFKNCTSSLQLFSSCFSLLHRKKLSILNGLLLFVRFQLSIFFVWCWVVAFDLVVPLGIFFQFFYPILCASVLPQLLFYF